MPSKGVGVGAYVYVLFDPAVPTILLKLDPPIPRTNIVVFVTPTLSVTWACHENEDKLCLSAVATGVNVIAGGMLSAVAIVLNVHSVPVIDCDGFDPISINAPPSSVTVNSLSRGHPPDGAGYVYFPPEILPVVDTLELATTFDPSLTSIF